jgi:hypothetical protein
VRASCRRFLLLLSTTASIDTQADCCLGTDDVAIQSSVSLRRLESTRRARARASSTASSRLRSSRSLTSPSEPRRLTRTPRPLPYVYPSVPNPQRHARQAEPFSLTQHPPSLPVRFRSCFHPSRCPCVLFPTHLRRAESRGRKAQVDRQLAHDFEEVYRRHRCLRRGHRHRRPQPGLLLEPSCRLGVCWRPCGCGERCRKGVGGGPKLCQGVLEAWVSRLPSFSSLIWSPLLGRIDRTRMVSGSYKGAFCW